MSHSYSDQKTINLSSNQSFAEILHARLSRRDLLKTAAALAVVNALPGCATGELRRDSVLGFKRVPVSTADAVIVPEGYSYSVLYAWGDPVGHASGSPAFKQDASNTADEQALQAGMHHDGIHYFPLPYGSDDSRRGLLVMNHEYTDDGLLHPDGFANWSAEKVRKAQNAHGMSVIEVRSRDGRWSVVRPSRYARRITASTAMRIAGPAAGAALVRTAADPSGRQVLGTFNDCAHGYTPWGTYLACEENWDAYFVNTVTLTADHLRNGIRPKGRRLPLARVRRALRRRQASERAQPLRLGGRDRSLRSGLGAGQAHRAGAFQPRRRVDHAFERRAPRGLHGRRPRIRIHLQVRVARPRKHLRPRGEPRSARPRHALRRAFDEDGDGEWVPLVHGRGRLSAAEVSPTRRMC